MELFSSGSAALDSPGDVTRLLRNWRNGDAAAEDELFTTLYGELRRIAHRQRERLPGGNDTLNTTALVHEVYHKLDRADLDARDCSHFLCIATRAMRQILMDYARERKRQKRGAGALRVTLGPLSDRERRLDEQAALFLDIDRAMARLKKKNPRLEQIAELHFFGGLNYDEIAEALGIGRATVARDWQVAKALLRKELEERE